MTDIYPIKQGFGGGVISPRKRGEVQSEAYEQGFSECNNWVITAQKSIKMRSGFNFQTAVPGTTGRIITFPRRIGEDVIMHLDGSDITLYDRNGVIEGAGIFSKDPTLSQPNQFWVIGGGGLQTQQWTPGYRAYWTCSVFNTDNFIRQFIDNAPEDVYTMTLAVASEKGAGIFGNQYAQSFFRVLIGTTPGSGNIHTQVLEAGTWAKPEEYTVVFDTAGFGDSYYVTIRQELDEGGNSAFMHGAVYSPILITGSDTTTQTFASPWTEDQLGDIQFAVDSGTDIMYLVHPNVQPYKLDYDEPTRAWSFDPVTFTAKPTEWSGDNWPSVVEIWQQRLWLGSTPEQRSWLWGSKTGAYENFTIGTADDDAMEFQLSSSGTLQWLKGQNQLLIGNNEGEWVLTSTTGLVTPTDFQFNRQSGYAATDIQPVYAGKQISYVGLANKKVRVTQESEEARGWIGQEISLIADNLLQPGVNELVYSLEPDYQLCCLLNTYSLACCTYDVMNQLLAWYTLTYAQGGEIISLAVSNDLSGQIIWALVLRDGVMRMEFISNEETLQRNVDSFVRREIEVVTQRNGAYNTDFSSAFSGGFVASETRKVATGLEHLEGKTVKVIYERVVDFGQIELELQEDAVVNFGEIELDPNIGPGNVIVGLGYEALAKTLPQEGGNPGGTAQGTKRKWNRIFSRLAFSARPLLNGYRVVIDDSEIPENSMNALDAILTGDYEVRDEGYEDGVVEIKQDLPLPTEVVALFGKSQSGVT